MAVTWGVLVVAMAAVAIALVLFARHHGLWVVIGRFVAGLPMSGRWRPDWPQARKAAQRNGAVAALAAAWYGWLLARTAALVTLCLIAAMLLAAVGWLCWRWVRSLKVRRQWLKPLHLAAHGQAGHTGLRPHQWLEVGLDADKAVEWARLSLPPGWPAEKGDEARLVATAAAKLAIEAPEVEWRKFGPRPQVILRHAPAPPPSLVTWDDVAPAVARAKADEFVVGVGKQGGIVTASLSGDSPHLMINMGSGAGKSALAAFLIMQWLRRGGVAMILDSKWMSQPWLYKDAGGEFAHLPNVGYLRTPGQLHAGMVWLGGELERRSEVAYRAVDATGALHGSVGAPLLIVAEELNLATPKLKQLWAEVRDRDDVKKSPALTGLGQVAFAGRALSMHLLLIGQMLTAEVTGSRDNSLKENIQIAAMARYGTSGWQTAVGRDIPMPPVPSVLGRIQLVTAGRVREVQTPKPDLLTYRRMVLDGLVTPCPAGMPGAVTVAGHQGLPAGPDLRKSPATGTAQRLDGVTLSQAVELGVVSLSLAALRQRRNRARRRGDGSFPEPLDRNGQAEVFDPEVLAAYAAGKVE